MRGIKRVIDTSFWLDNKVQNFSAEDKYFMLFLLSNLYTTQLGIYFFPVKRVAIDMGYSEETVKVLLERFEKKYQIIEYSNDTDEVMIKNYLRYSIMKGGKPVMDCLVKEESQVKNTQLLVHLYNHLSKYMNDSSFNLTVKEYLNHIKEKYISKDKDNEKENDNDNDNENERIVENTFRIDDYFMLKDIIIAKSIKLESQGNCTCEWCGNSFESLEKHHFPLPRRAGGTEIVNICHTCHKSFHDFEYRNSMGFYGSNRQANRIESSDSSKSDADDGYKKDIKEIIDYLNTVCNTRYTGKNKTSNKHITARLREGFTVDDFKDVIDKKAKEWIGTDMEKYLCPDTLFSTKFEKYLNQKTTQKRTKLDELWEC